MATTMRYGRRRTEERFARVPLAALAIPAAYFALVGIGLALGGSLSRDGSAFDVLVGLGLIGSGFLLSRRHRPGGLTSMLALAGTTGRSLRNIADASSRAQLTIGRLAAGDGPAEGAGGRPPVKARSAMIGDWQASLRAGEHHASAVLPPATVEETGWDILLALHSDRHCRLNLEKLAAMVSVPYGTVERWLGALEDRKLITAARHPSTGELLAALTEMGRRQLDRYFSATKDFQAGATP